MQLNRITIITQECKMYCTIVCFVLMNTFIHYYDNITVIVMIQSLKIFADYMHNPEKCFD